MSLFDAIKYPVTDIMDGESLRNIPESILREWGIYILEIVGYVSITNLIKNKNIDWCYAGSVAVSYITNTDPIIYNQYKQLFLRDLRKRIEDYNTEENND